MVWRERMWGGPVPRGACAQKRGMQQRLWRSSVVQGCDSDILTGEKSWSLLILNEVWWRCSDVFEDSLTQAMKGKDAHPPVVVRSPRLLISCYRKYYISSVIEQSRKAQRYQQPNRFPTRSRKHRGICSPSFGGNDSQHKRKCNVQINILKTFHFSLYEINTFGIFYHANQGHFPH